MSRMDWGRAKKRQGFEPAFEKKEKPKGGWTHIKRQPVRQLSAEEIAAYLANRPDLRGAQ